MVHHLGEKKNVYLDVTVQIRYIKNGKEASIYGHYSDKAGTSNCNKQSGGTSYLMRPYANGREEKNA